MKTMLVSGYGCKSQIIKIWDIYNFDLLYTVVLILVVVIAGPARGGGY